MYNSKLLDGFSVEAVATNIYYENFHVEILMKCIVAVQIEVTELCGRKNKNPQNDKFSRNV